jgi:hypothetical protein
MGEMNPNASNVNPLALLFLVMMSLVILGSNRRNALKALLVSAALIPLGQQIVVFGLHFYFLRILILAGLGRLLMCRDSAGFRLLAQDKLFICWVLAGLTCGILRGPSGETFGTAYNALGVYFLTRILTPDTEDLLSQLRVLACVGVVIAGCMAWEFATHRNLFCVLGGVREFSDVRNGHIRCQGPFGHAILGGTFGATLFPLMIGLWFQGGHSRWLAFLGAVAGVGIALTSASSGALLTMIAAITGLALWPMRERMQVLRRGAFVTVIGLMLVMNAPVWYLISRVSDLVGGGGWHRSYLIEQFIRHFNEWWLVGTSYTAHWAPGGEVLLVDPNNMDITNHFVTQAIQGGILGLGLFLAIITFCFRAIGRCVRGVVGLALDRRLAWGFGVALASHCVAFVSISYFDQINVFWFWLLAAIPTVSASSSEISSSGVRTEPAPNLNGRPADPVPIFN